MWRRRRGGGTCDSKKITQFIANYVYSTDSSMYTFISITVIIITIRTSLIGTPQIMWTVCGMLLKRIYPFLVFVKNKIIHKFMGNIYSKWFKLRKLHRFRVFDFFFGFSCLSLQTEKIHIYLPVVQLVPFHHYWQHLIDALFHHWSVQQTLPLLVIVIHVRYLNIYNHVFYFYYCRLSLLLMDNNLKHHVQVRPIIHFHQTEPHVHIIWNENGKFYNNKTKKVKEHQRSYPNWTPAKKAWPS